MGEKPAYKLRKGDFVPIKGILKYHSRDIEDLEENGVISGSQTKYFLRSIGLIAYNVAGIYLTQALFFKGIEKLVS